MCFILKVRHLPNCITIFRILGALCLIPLPAMSLPFYILHTLCGLSDAADGFLARRLHLESGLGAKLDSVADLTFWGVILLKVLPVIVPSFGPLEYGMLGTVLVLRIASYATAFLRFRRFPALHTWLNKLTGLGLFAAVYLLGFCPVRPVCTGLFAIAFPAACEEWAMHLTAKKLCPNRHSILEKEHAA